jgi:hypothetical protein
MKILQRQNGARSIEGAVLYGPVKIHLAECGIEVAAQAWFKEKF